MNNMNRVLAGLGLGLGLVGLQGPVAAAGPPKATVTPPRHEIVAGVDLDAVEWAKLCPSVKPVSVTSGGKTCAVVHPASGATHHYYDGPLPCGRLEKEYARLTHPDADADNGWAHCKVTFGNALRARLAQKEGFDTPLNEFKKLYFGGTTK